MGLDENGFANNFNLHDFILEGDGTYAYLADLIDNGNRSSAEALYVEDLDVLTGTTLNLNGLNLYTNYNPGTDLGPYLVLAGDGTKFGGGTILNAPVPIPGAVWLLGSGLIGLAGLRKRFMKG